MYTELLRSELQALVPQGSDVALFDFPKYSNVGDSAIWLGEELFLRDVLKCSLKLVEEVRPGTGMLRKLPRNTIVMLSGGGNLGDLWPRHQVFREKIISFYQEHRVIQLPQSIKFRVIRKSSG
jgi:pyruvyl transferase EpsO